MIITTQTHTNSLTKILDKAVNQAEITQEEAIFLLKQTDIEKIHLIRSAADQLRFEQVGNTVTYVINRNINFTNICEQHCSFCAFRRDEGETGAFWLATEQILAKAQAALQEGATEICMQGGLNPQARYQGTSLGYYLQLIKVLKQTFPQLHLHAFSPQEIQFIAREDQISYENVIQSLQAAGVESMPGTAAEVLVDSVRKIICPEKINSQTWLEIVGLAHRLGLPTTSTMLCGHIETPEQQVQHFEQLRSLQQTALEKAYPARITEFILLPFVGQDAPKALKNRVGRDQPSLPNTLLLTAVARLYLGKFIPHHQPSWVKLGLEGAKEALAWGCDDLGGTLMEEHITTMAGAKGGTGLTVSELQNAIQSLNRPYQQRNTLYQLI
ncbi:MAG: 7,8-didemethyl-8-hydroxy-5-deazariboflavin synthase subunit CofH [Snowella sp.]|jgi:FO synthase subunit 2|nr:MAG: 7,8-didemethyl-8-hydroxy-5-deazariboflavin synthase subunit CofH [Snowella sp.]